MAELIVALDLPTGAAALRVVERVGDAVLWYKVGPVLFVAEGPSIVRDLLARGRRVFLDLKWHDIPTTVGAAVEQAAALGASLATLHLAGGRAMLRAAVDAAAGRIALAGVGVLTSLDAQSYGEIVGRTVDDVGAELVRLARLGTAAGLDGVVTSPREVGALRAALGPRTLLVVPGVRRPGEAAGDQARTATPREAVTAGADLLVVGRPVTAAADPRSAALAILEDMGT
jgi:orotidine-5'-phosphate decarboxylase